jgi:hypothetical protein
MKAIRIVKFVSIGVVVVAALGWVTMLLWNWLVPELFNGPTVSFWQMLGLIALAKILFTGLGSRQRWHGTHHWKHRFYQKFSSMTPDEQQAFKARMKEKWCRPVRSSE